MDSAFYRLRLWTMIKRRVPSHSSFGLSSLPMRVLVSGNEGSGDGNGKGQRQISMVMAKANGRSAMATKRWQWWRWRQRGEEVARGALSHPLFSLSSRLILPPRKIEKYLIAHCIHRSYIEIGDQRPKDGVWWRIKENKTLIEPHWTYQGLVKNWMEQNLIGGNETSPIWKPCQNEPNQKTTSGRWEVHLPFVDTRPVTDDSRMTFSKESTGIGQRWWQWRQREARVAKEGKGKNPTCPLLIPFSLDYLGFRSNY